MRPSTPPPVNDLTTYLLGERSELRPLLEAIANAQDAEDQSRAAVEYLVVLAAARFAANGRPAEASALSQIRSQYERTFLRDSSEHARLLREIHASLMRRSVTDVTTALKLLGLFHRRQARYRMARASFAAAVELARRAEDPVEQLNALFWLGVTERYLGNLEVAESVHREQIALARRAGQPGQMVLAEANLGLVALRRGRIADARSLILRALNRAQELKDRELQGNCYHCLMLVETEAGRAGEAAVYGWEAYSNYESDEHRMRALQDCVVILYHAELFDAARAGFEIVAQRARDTAPRIHALIGLADVAAAQGDLDRFEGIADELLRDPAIKEMPYELMRLYRSLGLGYASLGQARDARRHLTQSLNVAEQLGFNYDADEMREELGRIGDAERRWGAAETLVRPSPAEYERLELVGHKILAERARHSA